MDGQSLLEIILRARDEASKTIEGVGNNIDDAAKKTANMATAFKVAGGVMLGVGLAGVGIMKSWADAASEHQTAMASVDATLKNVASTMDITTGAYTENTNAVGSSKKAIQEQIQALELQKAQLNLSNQETTQSITVTTGHGKTLKEHTKTVHENAAATKAQVDAIDQQIIDLKKSEQGIGSVSAVTAKATTVNTGQVVSLKMLQDITDQVSNSYLKLGFSEDETATSFAQNIRVTKNVADAQTLLLTAADLARLKHMSLTDATVALTRAYEGQTRILKGLGIEVDKGAKGMDVINKVQEATRGQAEAFAHTYAGASQVLGVEFQKLQATLGSRLIPSLSQFVTSIAGVIDKLNNLSPATYDTIVNIVKFGTAFALITGPILLFIGFLPALVAGFGLVAGVGLPVVLILAGLAIGAYLLYTNWSKIQPIISLVEKAVSSFVNNAGKQLTDFINKNKVTFQAFWSVIQGLFTFTLGFIQGFWNTTWQAMSDFLLSIWSIMKGVVEVAWGVISIFLDVAMGVFTGNWTKAWDGIKTGFGYIWQGIKDIALGVIGEIVNSVKLALDSVIGFINGVISGANSVMSKIPGNHTQIPLIPKFEQGGYVPKTGIALLHEGEFVLSKAMLAGQSSMPKTIQQTTNNNTPITINAQITQEMDLALLANRLAFAVRNSR